MKVKQLSLNTWQNQNDTKTYNKNQKFFEQINHETHIVKQNLGVLISF
jgi:hypothetical protein